MMRVNIADDCIEPGFLLNGHHASIHEIITAFKEFGISHNTTSDQLHFDRGSLVASCDILDIATQVRIKDILPSFSITDAANGGALTIPDPDVVVVIQVA
ncbi:MAG: hypothetical protein K2N48_09495 [Muribaculaceae bacterium]|nr:hypothetical protein [Muribaculaceae bacterium]